MDNLAGYLIKVPESPVIVVGVAGMHTENFSRGGEIGST